MTGDDMHKKYTVFETDIYETQCNLDMQALFQRCKLHQTEHSSETVSNRGGYQGHNFDDPEVIDTVLANVPRLPNKPWPRISVQSWVNINGPGHWNTLHNHLDEQCLISGILYVKCPADSGDLYCYDPRFFSNVGTHYQYYATDASNAGGYIQIYPRENLLVFFPPSLMHMVGPNMSDQERCSIAFNILVEPGQKLK
jgi:hypothetical protein